jgi:hypothetical protein
MRAKCLIPIAFALLAASAAKAGPHVPLCFALQNNFNECMRQQQRQNAWGGGYDRGWGDWDEDDGYEHYRRQRHQQRGAAKQAECARWLFAIQQNNCAN